MNEKEFVTQTFLNNFSKYKDKSLVLYGTGKNTESIIKNAPDYNIIGIMSKETHGVLYGKKILSKSEVVKADIIIIIAHYNVQNIIFNRIKNFAEKYNILVYDVYGNNLSIPLKIKYKKSQYYYDISEKDLKEQIDTHDVISFNIFDTLLILKIFDKKDIFEVVERKLVLQNKKISFKKEREEAELLQQKYKNLNITDVYKEMQKKLFLTDFERDYLLNAEINTIKDFIVSRKIMVDFLNYAISSGKIVYLITDGYYPIEILEEFLNLCNISGYKSICSFNDFESKNRLHIGTDYNLSYKNQNLEEDFDFFKILSAKSMLEISTYNEIKNSVKTLEDKVMIGIFLAKIFNNPFVLYKTDGKYKLKNIEQLGYFFVAPLVLRFMLWFYNEIKKSEFDCILFASRDGYLMKRIYAILKENYNDINMPDGIYFLTSRKAAVTASIENMTDVLQIVDITSTAERNSLLINQFSLPKEELLLDNQALDTENKKEALLPYKNKILEYSNIKRVAYQTYIKTLDIDRYNKIAITDFAGRGSVQYFMSKVIMKELTGFYICKWSWIPPNGSLICKSFYKENDAGGYAQSDFIYKYSMFLETIITSPEPMVDGFAEDGTVIYSKEMRERKQLQFIKSVQDDICKYCEEFLALKIPLNNQINESNFYDKMLELMSDKYTQIDRKDIEQLVVYDDWVGYFQKVGKQLE